MKDSWLVSGSRDSTIRVWDLDTGRCRHVLRGHTDSVRCLELQGRFAVSGSYDHTVRVWDYQRGTVCRPLSRRCTLPQRLHARRATVVCADAFRYDQSVHAVAVDETRIVSSSMDHTIRVWDIDTGRCLHKLEGVRSVRGRRRTRGLADGGRLTLKGCPAAAERVRPIAGHASLVGLMQLRGDVLVSGGADHRVRVWNVANGQCVHDFESDLPWMHTVRPRRRRLLLLPKRPA